MPLFQKPILGMEFSFEERSDKRSTEMGGRDCALESLCFSQRTSLGVLACSMDSRSLGSSNGR